MDFVILVNHRLKIKESKKDIQILESCQRIEKAVEHEGDANSNCSWNSWNSSQRPGKETGETRHQKTNQDFLDYSIVKIR